MKTILLKSVILIFFVFQLSLVYSQTEFHLASEGKASYDIIVSSSASSAERFAAEELVVYLEKMSKVDFAIKSTPERASIFIGTPSSVERYFFSIPSAKESEQSGVFTYRNDVFLTGGDSRGVIYSVYGFLQQLGCRWIAPDYDFFEGSVRHIPYLPKLTYYHTKDMKDKPEVKYRKFYVEEGKTHTVENLLQLIDWMPKLRYNTLVIPHNYQGTNRVMWDNWRERLTPELQKRGIVIEVGGHGYENFLNASMEGGKLFKLHPEWFGMEENGKRTSDKHAVFCTSNDEAVHYLQGNVIAYLKSHPEIEIFDFWPPDMERWCNCLECKKTTPEHRHFELVNKMAKIIKEQFKGRKLECLAYSRYVVPPMDVKLDPTVLLDFCAVTQNFQKPFYSKENTKNKMYNENLEEWLSKFEGDISFYSYYRKYKWRSLPNIFPHYIQNDLKYFNGLGVKGISIYSEPGDWFTYGPNYYILGHLAQHTDADIDSLMSEYAGMLYGEAKEVMLEVYKALEEVVPNGCSFPDSDFVPIEQYDEFYNRIEEMSRKVGDARNQYGTNQTILDNHLQRVQLMLKYVLMSIRQQQQAARDNKHGNYRLTDEMREFFRANKRKGVFVI